MEDRRLLSFTPAVNYDAATSPSAIATADFNNDGKLDLATVVGYSAGRVSVRLGNGAGGFGTAQEFAAPYSSSIFVADINNDTRPDMVVGEDGGYHILLGNGDGTFRPAVYTFAGGGAVAVGRFNGDSNIDVVVNWLDGDWATHVQVYCGNGQGGFAAAPDAYYWGWGGMAAVDLNNDGKLDVATGEGLAFLGDGTGRLQFDWGQLAPLSGGAIATGDFTGEGNADVIVASNSVAVLRGRGDGGFDPPTFHSANGTVHNAVATADLNGDGKLDAVVANGDTGTVSAMLGNGDGTLRYAGAFATGTSPRAVTVGDFNGDGRLDVAVANAGSNTVSVLLNDGAWLVTPSLGIGDVALTEGNSGTAVATFTVSLSATSAQTITVAYATGNGTTTAGSDYQAASNTLVFAPGETSKTIAVMVNGDRLAEPNETIVVNLSGATNATIADGQGVGTILDDEPRISINDVTKSEGRKYRTTLFTFTVSLSAAYDQPVTVSYRTVNGTATTGNNDYIAKFGTLTFAPGETTKTITIEVKGDNKREDNETFFVDLFGNSSNSLFTKSRGIGTILNDD